MSEKIFLIHGLFMHGVVMQYMEKQLKDCGYDVYTFSYRSIRFSLPDNADKLLAFVEENSTAGDTRHFVGHSLGGLLIRLAYERNPHCFTGRIVTIGTPHSGSEVAKRVASVFHAGILGKAYHRALDGELPAWRGEVELGSIAGTKCIGIGMAWEDLEKPNDGTVTVHETRLPNATDHTELPLSHTALVYSKRVIRQTDCFLRNGHFE